MRKRTIAVLLGMLTISVMLLSFSIPVFASNFLFVVRVQQAKTNWRWAATAETIGKYVSRSVSTRTQSQIVQYIKGNTANNGATTAEFTRAITYATAGKAQYATYNGAMTYTRLKSEINKLGPIGMVLTWTGGVGRHAVTLCEYEGPYEYIWVSDPAVGCGIRRYTYTTTGTQYQSGYGKWTHGSYKFKDL